MTDPKLPELEDEHDHHEPCSCCGEEHPVGVLEDGECPRCVDYDDDGNLKQGG